jgi:fatty acid desaturase
MSPIAIPEETCASSIQEQFSLDDATVKGLVRDLHRANRATYWADLIGCCVLGWTSFAAAVVLPPFSPWMLAAVVVSICTLYRALCFMHEITHQSARSLPYFETVWNWLVGFPLLMPSFVYVGVHQSHHRISVYGTAQDPEYLPFAHSRRMTTVFALESFFIPIALLVRFIVLTPIGLLFPRFQEMLVVYGSSLTMNVKYRREYTPELMKKVRLDSFITFAIWAAIAAVAFTGILPWRVFVVWFAVDSLISFINTLRTLGAHAYENEGEQMDRTGQLLDSIDTPGAFYTELWAPVGLRYHALHHYFPGIPYHNLAEAYSRIMNHVLVSAGYSKMTSPSLQHSLRELCRKGAGK